MVAEVQWKPLELVLPGKIVNQKQYHNPGRIAEISGTINCFKDAKVRVPITLPFNSSVWHVQKMDVSWKMMVNL